MRYSIKIIQTILVLLICSACSEQSKEVLISKTDAVNLLAAPYSEGDDIPATAYIEHQEVYNAESVIPPQCYTKTEGTNNPCYACHQSYKDNPDRSNTMNDGDLQGEYQFSDLGTKNHWKNLFVDRTQFIEKISDDEIKQWISQDNYTDFVKKFSTNESWQGEVTPIKNLAYPNKAFDDKGLAKDGSHWVALTTSHFQVPFGQLTVLRRCYDPLT